VDTMDCSACMDYSALMNYYGPWTMLLICVDILVLDGYVGGISLNTCLYHIMMYYFHCECS
jgi:fatty acid/phospholipid biosynthesis enzyme